MPSGGAMGGVSHGLALFHIVHWIWGLDGPTPSTNRLCGSMLVDVQVDVGRFFVAEGRAGRGRVKNVAKNSFKI